MKRSQVKKKKNKGQKNSKGGSKPTTKYVVCDFYTTLPISALRYRKRSKVGEKKRKKKKKKKKNRNPKAKLTITTTRRHIGKSEDVGVSESK